MKIDELIDQGYIYHDLPKLDKERFDLFISVVGEENIEWLTKAHYENWRGGGVDYYRGQMLLSPTGEQRASDYANRSPAHDH